MTAARCSDSGSGALAIHQDAAIYGGRLEKDAGIAHTVRGNTGAYILVSAGEIDVNGTAMKAGDGAEVTNEPDLAIRSLTDAELLIIEV